MPEPRLPLHRWIIRIVSGFVPKRLRADWRREWEAELEYQEEQSAKWRERHQTRWLLIRQSLGSSWDALSLQRRRLEDDLVQDVRHGVRLATRSPGLALAACLSITVGIGGSTAAFSLLDAALLRQWPYPDADRLVVVRYRYWPLFFRSRFPAARRTQPRARSSDGCRGARVRPRRRRTGFAGEGSSRVARGAHAARPGRSAQSEGRSGVSRRRVRQHQRVRAAHQPSPLAGPVRVVGQHRWSDAESRRSTRARHRGTTSRFRFLSGFGHARAPAVCRAIGLRRIRSHARGVRVAQDGRPALDCGVGTDSDDRAIPPEADCHRRERARASVQRLRAHGPSADARVARHPRRLLPEFRDAPHRQIRRPPPGASRSYGARRGSRTHRPSTRDGGARPVDRRRCRRRAGSAARSRSRGRQRDRRGIEFYASSRLARVRVCGAPDDWHGRPVQHRTGTPRHCNGRSRRGIEGRHVLTAVRIVEASLVCVQLARGIDPIGLDDDASRRSWTAGEEHRADSSV